MGMGKIQESKLSGFDHPFLSLATFVEVNVPDLDLRGINFYREICSRIFYEEISSLQVRIRSFIRRHIGHVNIAAFQSTNHGTHDPTSISLFITADFRRFILGRGFRIGRTQNNPN
jgi:hypothetical protein